MGKSKSTQTSEQQAFVEPMSQDEQSIVKQLEDVGVDQATALRLVRQQASQQPGLIGLQGSDQALLDQAYSGAESNLRRQGYLMGQDLAGTRGLNPSDTPVSEAVLREMLPALSSLQSAKANESLGLGLNLQQLNQQRLQTLLGTVGQTPNALLNLANRYQTERFAKAKTIGTNTVKNNPSLMSQIGQGIGLVGQLAAVGVNPGGFASPQSNGNNSNSSNSSSQNSSSGSGQWGQWGSRLIG